MYDKNKKENMYIDVNLLICNDTLFQKLIEFRVPRSNA